MNLKTCFSGKNILFFIFTLLVILFIVKMTDIALLIFLSYVISSAVNPLIDKLSKKMSRTVATVLVIVIVSLLIIGLLLPIVIMSVNEIKDFLNTAPSQIDNLIQFFTTHKFNGRTLSEMMNIGDVLSNSSGLAREVIGRSINFTISFVGILTVFVTMGIIVFFLSNDRDKIKNYSLKLFPLDMRNRASEVIDELEVKVGGYVSAQLLCITLVGMIVTISLIVLKVDYAVFLGFISAVFDLIPIVGPTVAGVLILFAASSKGVLISVLAVFATLLAQFVENNWARPYFFSKYMNLHPLVVIFSFVIAAKLLGVVGVIVAPAIAAVIITLFDELYIKTMNSDNILVSENPEENTNNG